MPGLLRKTNKVSRTLRAAQGAQESTPPADAEVPAELSGSPRIVINPTTFHNKKDALCVAFNEGFRVIMEAMGFEPQSEPTDAQRKFFSDTAYADDEVQLRRTILARIATFDTSVKDPTDDQLAETGAFLDAILESPDWCKNDWERNAVSRLSQAVKAAVGAEPVEPRPEPVEPREPEPLQSRAALGGGETDDKQQQEAPQQEAPQPGQPEDGRREAIVAALGAELDARAKSYVAAADRTIESLNQHIASAEALGKIADNWNKTSDQILAQGKELLSGADEREAAQEPGGSAEVPRKGAIENDIVSKDSPGSIAYKGQRKGAIENPIVDPSSPGSIAYKGQRKGAISPMSPAWGNAFTGDEEAFYRAKAKEEQNALSTSADAKLDDRGRKQRKV